MKRAYEMRISNLRSDVCSSDLDSNVSYERIYQALADSWLDVDLNSLVLAGFNELSPRLSLVLSALGQRGVRVCVLTRQSQAAGATQRVQAPDPDGEWRLAAQWAAGQLAQNPKGRYAIVAARLEAAVVLAHRYLRECLGQDEGGRPKASNVAVARPLAEWPLARAALSWLRVLAGFSQRTS